MVEGQEVQEECLEDLEDSNIIAVVFNHRYLFLKKELLKVDQENKILIGYKPELNYIDNYSSEIDNQLIDYDTNPYPYEDKDDSKAP